MTARESKATEKITKQEIESLIKEYAEIESGAIPKALMDNNKIKEISQNAVFANTEVHLSKISAFGFDYDYTIANYTPETTIMTFNEAKKILVEKLKYPKPILDIEFDKNFAIRGLHFDTKTGNLLKLNQFSKIERDSVYYGKRLVPMEKVEQEFPGRRVSDSYALENMVMMGDIFDTSFTGLLSETIDYFVKNNIDFETRNIFADVKKAICNAHSWRCIHNNISENPEKYLRPAKGLVSLVKKLLRAGKKVFLLTNNEFPYVDFGCRRLFEDIVNDKSFGVKNWTEIFDVVIMNANKPRWYDCTDRFRIWDPEKQSLGMRAVVSFERGNVYYGGSFDEFSALAGFPMSEVLYMGDNVYTDIRNPRKFCHWHTVAILNELESEIQIMNDEKFKNVALSLFSAERLFLKIRSLKDQNDGKIIPELSSTVKKVKDLINKNLVSKRQMFNTHFGSVFRTANSASKFFYNVQRYADLYTSKVDNFDNFTLDTALYVKTRYFAHEMDLNKIH